MTPMVRDPITENLVTFASHLTYEDLTPSCIHETKRRILDSIGCAYGAYHCEPARLVRKIALQSKVTSDATPGRIIGLKDRVSLDWATFANGAMIRYLDYNDTYLSKEPAHPSDNIAATLSVASAHHKTGQDLILATVIAYEIQCRLCDVASLRARGWDHTTYGPFSSSLAAARLMSCGHTQMVNAVGIAGTCNNAMRQTRLGNISMWKACAFAAAARGGVQAAMLAAQGFTGPSDIFVGKMGFQKQVSGPFELPKLSFNPKPFMLENTYIKDHPAEYHSQSAIDVAKDLHKKIKNFTQIKKVIVQSHDASVDIIGSEPEKWHPKDKETADHSLPYITACALMFGTVKLEHFTPQYFSNKNLDNLVQKTIVERDKAFSALYGKGGFGNRIIVQMEDGTTLQGESIYPKGHPKNPHTDEELMRKFKNQCDVLSQNKQPKLLDAIWKLDTLTDVHTLFDLMECDG